MGPRAIAFWLCASVLATAQATDLTQAWNDALAHDPLIASARSALQASRERVAQARATTRPAAQATAAVSRQTFDTNLTPRQSYTSEAYAISLSYPLYRPQNYALLEQARLQSDVSQAQFDQALQDLMIRVSQAYFDVLAAQDTVETIQAQRRAITEQLSAAKRNFEVGTATVTDQQEAQARFDLNIAQALAADNDLEVRRAALSLLTGKPAGDLDALARDTPLRPPQPSVEREWTEAARASNLQVVQAGLGSEVARREIQRQRYGHYPTLDVVTGVQRQVNPTPQLLGLNLNGAQIGLQLTVPIYSGGGVDARVRESAALFDKSQTDLENARRQAEQATRTAFLGVSSGLAQVNALQAAERSSQLALESNVLGYQVGVRINIDVLNAQQQLYSTRRDLSRARYDVLVNGLRLKQAAGSLSEQDLAAINGLLGPVTR